MKYSSTKCIVWRPPFSKIIMHNQLHSHRRWSRYSSWRTDVSERRDLPETQFYFILSLPIRHNHPWGLFILPPISAISANNIVTSLHHAVFGTRVILRALFRWPIQVIHTNWARSAHLLGSILDEIGRDWLGHVIDCCRKQSGVGPRLERLVAAVEFEGDPEKVSLNHEWILLLNGPTEWNSRFTNELL